MVAGLWVLAGVAWAASTPIHEAAVAQVSGGRTGRGMSLLGNAGLAGAALGSVAAGTLYGVVSWPLVCVVFAGAIGLGALAGPAALARMRITDRPDAEDRGRISEGDGSSAGPPAGERRDDRDLGVGTDHRGIYGIWADRHGRLVLVRKSRGPYTGLLDLPGGAPEAGESPERTLRRELAEECGVQTLRVLSWHSFDLAVRQDSTGSPIDFRHHGLIAVLEVPDAPLDIRGVEDVHAVELHAAHALVASGCSPLLREGLAILGLPLRP